MIYSMFLRDFFESTHYGYSVLIVVYRLFISNGWHVATVAKLTHLLLVPHICVNELGNGSAPSHYLNQCWFIVDWTPGYI